MAHTLVIGATGRIGREVVAELAGSGQPVRALARRPDAVAFPTGVQVVAGDLTDPESLDGSLDNVDSVFLLWTAPPASAPAVVRRLADRVRRIVLLSSPHRTPHPFFQQTNPLAAFHERLDRLVMESGAEWAIIRPGMFASNATGWWAPQLARGDVVRWPYASVETAPIDDRDVAAVAARALVDSNLAGRDYVLTGPKAVSHAGQVAAIAAARRRAIQFVELSPDQFRDEMAGRFPPAALNMLLAAWEAAKGHPAFVTPTVAAVLGRPARTFDEWAADHVRGFEP